MRLSNVNSKISVLILLIGNIFLSQAQITPMPFREIQPDKLSFGEVFTIFEDRQGYKWFGAKGEPVVRFDGSNLRSYRRDSSGFFHDTAAALIFEDKAGDLWLGSWHGALMRYDLYTDRFVAVNDTLSSPRAMMYSFYEDDQGHFWIGSMGGGLIRFHPKTKAFKRYRGSRQPNDLPDDYVTALACDAKGNLWVGTTGGLCRYRAATDDFERIPIRSQNPADIYKYRVIRSLLFYNEEELYIGTFGGLHVLNTRTGRHRHMLAHSHPDSLSNNSLFRMVADKSGFVWIASHGGGLNRYDPRTGVFRHWRRVQSDPHAISSDNLYTVMIDRNENLWVGASEGTVCVHDLNRKKFHAWNYQTIPSLPAGRINSLYRESDSVFWLGYYGAGLCRFNIRNGQTVCYRHNPSDRSTISHNNLSEIIADRFDPDILWVGTVGGGLNKFRKSTGKFVRYEVNPGKNRIINNAVSSIYMDQDGLIWIAAHRDGISWYDPVRDRFHNYLLDTLNKIVGTGFATVTKIIEQQNVIWLSSESQVTLFDPKLSRFIPVVAPPGSLQASISSGYSELFPFNEEMLLFTDHAVLALRYTSGEGVQSRKLLDGDALGGRVKAMIVDQNGDAWLATTTQLIRHNLADGSQRNYTDRDGLTREIITDLTTDSDGNIFLLTDDGVVWFHPDEIMEDNRMRKVSLTDFKLFNRSMSAFKRDSVTGFTLPAPIGTRPQIELNHQQSFFSIEFVADEFAAPGSISYAYRLVGFDADWVYVGHRPFASYTSLPAGEYMFEVKAANPDGRWGQPTSLAMIIHPPFWQTTWFMIACGLLASVVLYGFHRYRLAQSLAMERVRTRIASDLHDEVGSNLTRISMYSDLVQQESDEHERAGYLTMINQVSREVIHTMSDIVWSIDSGRDSLGALVNRIREVAEQLFQPKGILIDWEAEGLPSERNLPPALRQHVFLIVKEALNNAARHARATRLQIRFVYTKSLLQLTIADDGIGFPGKDQPRGNGLRNMQRRAERIGAKLQIESNRGTRVQLEVPLK